MTALRLTRKQRGMVGFNSARLHYGWHGSNIVYAVNDVNVNTAFLACSTGRNEIRHPNHEIHDEPEFRTPHCRPRTLDFTGPTHEAQKAGAGTASSPVDQSSPRQQPGTRPSPPLHELALLDFRLWALGFGPWTLDFRLVGYVLLHTTPGGGSYVKQPPGAATPRAPRGPPPRPEGTSRCSCKCRAKARRTGCGLPSASTPSAR